ncbi:hypothetical protein AHF37_05655 [Paragonimus kellicotti]|nr:hypothetical protein AHF37_05655 [Paragonimus kellicotti]
MHQEECISVLSKNYHTNTASLLAVNGLNDLDRVIKLEIVQEHKQDDSMILFYRKREQTKDSALKLTDLALIYCAAFFGSVGRLSRAIMNCNWALERKPDWTKALFYRGVFKYLMSSYDLSSRDFSLAIDTDEQCFLAHYHRALCREARENWKGAFQASGQLKNALQVITQGIDTLTTTGGEVSSPSPEDEQVRESRMSSVHPMRCTSKAIAAAYECRALILLQMAQPHRALSDLTQALRLHPKQADYLVNRGTAHQRSGDLRSAMNDYR